ncbi:hypothetical protein VTI74DRAFT_5960 [Chaetomium olivicolor]
MDPATAIGLVSGILTFVDAARKVLKLSWTLYNSIEGSSEETAMRLKLAEKDRALVTLAQECNKLTNDIKKELHDLKPKRRKSKAQSAAAINFIFILPPCQDENLKELLATCREDGSKLARLEFSMAQLSQTLQDMTTMKTNYISDQALDQLKSLLHVGQDALNEVAQDRILRGIKAGFEAMSYRYQSVDRPFGETFEWVMDLGGNSPAAAKFSQWLSSGDGIFHICGKLGSGKSTLMKKLCSDQRTRAKLKKWTRERKLLIANFFFMLLAQTPDKNLTQTLFSEQWAKALSQAKIYSDYEILDDDIKRAYELLSKQHDGSSLGEHCFAFFIDGLDEYQATPAVDCREMVRCLADLATSNSGRFKICVSSRMENPFMDMFSEDTRLYLHKLTRTDMEEYVKGNLRCVGT